MSRFSIQYQTRIYKSYYCLRKFCFKKHFIVDAIAKISKPFSSFILSVYLQKLYDKQRNHNNLYTHINNSNDNIFSDAWINIQKYFLLDFFRTFLDCSVYYSIGRFYFIVGCGGVFDKMQPYLETLIALICVGVDIAALIKFRKISKTDSQKQNEKFMLLQVSFLEHYKNDKFKKI